MEGAADQLKHASRPYVSPRPIWSLFFKEYSLALRQTASWMCDYFAVKPSAIGQPTWPSQPSVPQGSVNE